MLGCGTFGQVVLCTSEAGHEVAIKVIKNQPAYFNQATIEAKILKLLNEQHDPTGERHIVRMQVCPFLQRKVFDHKHQFALQLIRDSTVIPNYLSLNPSSHTKQQHPGPAQTPRLRHARHCSKHGTSCACKCALPPSGARSSTRALPLELVSDQIPSLQERRAAP